MTTSMGPPPPKNPTAATTAVEAEPSTSESAKTAAMMMLPPPKTSTTTTTAAVTVAEAETSTSESTKDVAMGMAPPPSRIPDPSETEREAVLSRNDQQELEVSPNHVDTSDKVTEPSDSTDSSDNRKPTDVEKKQEQLNSSTAVPYTIPPWSAPPGDKFFLEVLKDGAIINQYDVYEKGAYMFGRVDLCDFVLEHPTISRFHAVLQFKSDRGAYLYDLGSTHGTFINKTQVKKRVYMDLHVGDVIRFGHSSRLYIFQGPTDLMPPEADLKRLKNLKIQQNMQDMEASLLRARVEASRADGISWGMDEDAVEENEDEVDEITWQTYKGQLTEKQEKTRDKVIKRLEKIAHMKKEIDAIRAKDIAQGGLTQGQQTQIARNEQRTSQIMEELENLEETLNESIRESLGARAGKLAHGKRKGTMEDEEDDYMSDDDEFYDRTRKPSKLKSGENQSVETADSLLDKKDALIKQMEDKQKLLLDEDKPEKVNEVAEAGDALDAYMSAVSSQLVLDNKEKIQTELSTLQSELDRILYLLKIADPTGEAARKRESQVQKTTAIVKKKPDSRSSQEKNKKVVPSSEKGQSLGPEDSAVKPIEEKPVAEKPITEEKSESDMKREEPESVADQSTATVYTVAKPQWLGAVEERKKQEITQASPADTPETDHFVDYKDRTAILTATDSSLKEQDIEAAAPGLIIRKRKQVEKSEPQVSEAKNSDVSVGSGLKAEDAVALLLKHSRGYSALDEEDKPISEDLLPENEGRKDGKRAKRVLGPEKPSFLNEPDYSSWVPPEGQSGDGRTSLNDRFGY